MRSRESDGGRKENRSDWIPPVHEMHLVSVVVVVIVVIIAGVIAVLFIVVVAQKSAH